MNLVPTHLADCLDILESDSRTVRGLLHCPCGSNVFSPLFLGTTMELNGRRFPYGKTTEDGVFFIIAARCVKCGIERVLFDEDMHGWDGFVCRDLGQASRPRPALDLWKCLSCGNGSHSVEISLSHIDADDLREDLRDFPIDNLADAFEWITISIRCEKCCSVTEKWVDYETA